MIANRVKKGEDCKKGGPKKEHKGQEKDSLTFLYIGLQVSIHDDIQKKT
jgi:hypothetical protein